MKEHLNRREIIEAITPVIENTAMRYNLIPIEIELEKESGNWFLRVYIFSTDHPVNHQDCENLSRGLDNFLDDLIPFKYRLEISSPGLYRKIKTEREYVLFEGKNAIIKLENEIDKLAPRVVDGENIISGGEKKIEVKLLGYEKGIGVKVYKYNTGEEHTIPLSNIQQAQLNDE